MKKSISKIKVGRIYNYFDDGKIKPSRKSNVEIKEIIPFSEIGKEILEQWKTASTECNWIYNPTTDYFIIGELDLQPEVEKVVFVRTKTKSWFSLGWWAGYLDYDGSLLKQMKKYYNS